MKRAAGLCLAPLLALTPQGRQGGGPPPVYRTEVPAHAYDIVFGNVAADRASVRVLCHDARRGRFVFGAAPGTYTRSLPRTEFPKDEPVALELTGLTPGTRYYGRIEFDGESSAERSVTTAPAPGRAFTFAVQADSHLDGGTDPAVYLRSLAATRGADFLVDLGDTFMVDKYPHYTDAHAQYLAQCYYFDQARLPVFLVPGNHDGELGRWRDGTSENRAEWARKERLRYFPSAPEGHWAQAWGDALLIGLDPYWNTTGRGRRDGEDNWHVTLGKEQYDWLKATLEKSRARWKFVFIHNLVGGRGKDGRGGSEVADRFEWGGKSADGADDFAARRPGWDAPIHALLRKHKVAAVFHGHDHLYARQERDGIVYQCVPQSGHGHGGGFRSAGEYGYVDGTILDGSGVLLVSVAPQGASVTFLRTDRGAATEAHRYALSK